MQLLTHLRRAGWFELSQSFPDRGPLHEVAWHTAILSFGGQGFSAIVAANADGVRVAVGSGVSAIFLPWSDVVVSAGRGLVDTQIRLDPIWLSATPLVLHLDDEEADQVLRSAGVVLSARRQPRAPSLWIAGALGVFLALLGAAWWLH